MDTVVLQLLQSLVGVLLQACMAGVVFAKVSRPKRRARSILFSRQAVVCTREGKRRLMVRVANIRHSQLLEVHFKGLFFLPRCRVGPRRQF